MSELLPRIIFRDKRDADTLLAIMEMYRLHVLGASRRLSALRDVTDAEGIVVVGIEETEGELANRMSYSEGLMDVLRRESARLAEEENAARDAAHAERAEHFGLRVISDGT
jgi:hypothetical protein